MIEVTFSNSFKKSFQKKIKNNLPLKKKFWEKVDIFISDPFDVRLKTHKLSGKLKDLWSFSVEYDVRIIFFFPENEKAVFIDIGTHDEVY